MCTVNVHKFSCFVLRHRRIWGHVRNTSDAEGEKLSRQEERRKRRMTLRDMADLCALCDGVSLLWAEVRQDVCRVPLTGVVNSWTSCIQKKKTKTCQQKVTAAVRTLEPEN